jgi:hypothetical protein
MKLTKLNVRVLVVEAKNRANTYVSTVHLAAMRDRIDVVVSHDELAAVAVVP